MFECSFSRLCRTQCSVVSFVQFTQTVLYSTASGLGSRRATLRNFNRDYNMPVFPSGTRSYFRRIYEKLSAGSVAVRDLLLTFLLLTFHGDSYVLRYSVPVSLGQRVPRIGLFTSCVSSVVSTHLLLEMNRRC